MRPSRVLQGLERCFDLNTRMIQNIEILKGKENAEFSTLIKNKGFFKTGYLSYLPPLNRVNWHFLERVSARYAGVIESKI